MDRWFSKLATRIANTAGNPLTFVFAFFMIIVWGVLGPLYHYSDTWQLVINTATTIITFLMVFLIQNTQNRDSKAIQVKLDALISAISKADNKFIGVEDHTQSELDKIKQEFKNK